jgi:hypothetical protein
MTFRTLNKSNYKRLRNKNNWLIFHGVKALIKPVDNKYLDNNKIRSLAWITANL